MAILQMAFMRLSLKIRMLSVHIILSFITNMSYADNLIIYVGKPADVAHRARLRNEL